MELQTLLITGFWGSKFCYPKKKVTKKTLRRATFNTSKNLTVLPWKVPAFHYERMSQEVRINGDRISGL